MNRTVYNDGMIFHNVWDTADLVGETMWYFEAVQLTALMSDSTLDTADQLIIWCSLYIVNIKHTIDTALSFVNAVRSRRWCVSVWNGINQCFWYKCSTLWYNASKCCQLRGRLGWWNSTTYCRQAPTKPVPATFL